MDGADAAGPARAGGTIGEAGEGARRIPGEVFEARLRARAVVGEAEERARTILRTAEGEVRAWREAAEEAGHQEGMARAAAEVVRAAIERDRVLEGARAEVAEAAVAVAGFLLGREVRPGTDALAAAERVLGEVRGARRATLRVAVADLAAVREASGALGEGVGALRVVQDPGLAPGEVTVEADGARVDGRFGARLDELRRALRGQGT